ncbi:hypothetical protein EPYR_02900 [Erwinia pyrifoliae DSM 12163]|nr:hypothetical protein EPYR_02900 [Erwinia pyrifoliae DSM 12163]
MRFSHFAALLAGCHSASKHGSVPMAHLPVGAVI